jgi:farnesyl-diphosphate farnesyltransferase
MPFHLTQSQQEYLDTRMNEVSRSFALVVPLLEEPLNHYIGAAYLICRVVDNIEDCEQPFAWQMKRFAEFRQLLHEPTCAREILAGWEGEDWPGLTPEEKRMMGVKSGLMLWQIVALMPDKVRLTIGRWALVMAEGMKSVNDPEQAPVFTTRQDVQVLSKEEDYNHYCYFVAGTVGHMVTELVIGHYRLNGRLPDRLLANCEAFGRGLQKTNIVKDFPKDLKRGVCYLPDQWMTEIAHSPLSLAGAPPAWTKYVLDDVLGELQDAVSYMLDLPYTASGYRMAGLLCLLPAYQTILQAAQNYEMLFTPSHHVKISHETMFQCLEDARTMVTDNEAILDYSQRTRTHVDVAFNGAGKPSSK